MINFYGKKKRISLAIKKIISIFALAIGNDMQSSLKEMRK